MSRRVPRGVETRSPAERGYDRRHRLLREFWKPVVAGGGVNCARCGKLIAVGAPWDLDHDDEDRTKYLGPSHRACNRRTAGRKPKPRASRKW